MQFPLCSRRLTASVIAALMSIPALPVQVAAAEPNATFALYPHCIRTEENKVDDWVLGPIPSPGIVAETRQTESVQCETFDVRDPQTLQTRPLREGDILDIDIVVRNPKQQAISRVRSWLIYDPDILEGVSAEIQEFFPLTTPGEEDFSPTEGYVKLEGTAETDLPHGKQVLFARVQFRVLKTSPIGTPITFHDAQPGGHSVIMTTEGGSEMYILKQEPGVLLVRFADDNTPAQEPQSSPKSIFDTPPPPAPAPADPNSCLRNEDCDTGFCLAGKCAEPPAPPALLQNGESCTQDIECESGICSSGICVAALPQQTTVPPSPPSTGGRTAFSLLQIQNLRVTTEGTSIFLAWDHLLSSQLKAYNIYYGKTSGTYIQRRTIDKAENTITLRNMTPGDQYFLSVRALSSADEESAFSQEVAVIVGEPSSSSAPLTLGSLPASNPLAQLPQNTANQGVPGETGTSSALALFLVLSAVIGTVLAARRQKVALPSMPHV